MDDNFTVELFGIPFFSAGLNPKAVIAVGLQPTGIIAIGVISVGIIALGQASFGLFTLGQLTSGFACLGQLAVGFLVLGQLGIGIIAGFGQAAVGFISNGLGYYRVSGSNIKDILAQVKKQYQERPGPLRYWLIIWAGIVVSVIYYMPEIKRYISLLKETGAL